MSGSYSDMPMGMLALGLFFLLLAFGGTFEGEAWARWGRVIKRAEKPMQFWFLVSFYNLFGVGLIGYCFFLVGPIKHPFRIP